MSQFTELPLPCARTCAVGEAREVGRSAPAASQISRGGKSDAARFLSEYLRSDGSRFAGSGSHLGERDGVRGGLGVTHAGGASDDVRLELVRGIVDALGSLRAGRRAVNAAGGLGGVAAQEGALVQEQHAPAVLQHGVRGGQPREAAADDDDLLAHRDPET